MPTYEFTTAESYGHAKIAIFARERNTGQRVRIDVTDYEPYLYVHQDEKPTADALLEDEDTTVTQVIDGFESIEDEPIVKVIFSSPRSRRNIEDNFSQTWEADVNFVQNFRIDTYLKSVFTIPDGLLKHKYNNRYETSWSGILSCEDETQQIDKRKFVFDIEVSSTGGKVVPENPEHPVPCITAWDSHKNQYISWVWRHDFETSTVDDAFWNPVNDSLIPWEVRRFNSEIKMFGDFLDHLKNTDYDLISGWYSDKFDIPYVINRIRELGLDAGRLSPMGIVQNSEDRYDGQARIRGLLCNDLERRYDNIESPDSTALENVAADELDLTWEQEASNIPELWENDVDSLLEYNCWDVLATAEVDRVAGVTDFFLDKMEETGVQSDDIERASNVIDYYHLYEAHDDEILPTTDEPEHADFGGGVVFDPTTQGVVGPVAVLDLSKIYPSIMISLGLTYENYAGRDHILLNESITITDEDSDGDEIQRTFSEGDEIDVIHDIDKKGRMSLWDELYELQPDGTPQRAVNWEFVQTTDEGTRLPNGARFHIEDGLTTRVLEQMFTLRYKYEDQMEMLDADLDDYHAQYDRLDNKKSVAKGQINGVYGVMGYTKFRLFRPAIPETVTFIGRNILEMAREVVEKRLGHEVIYGDTDSVMVLINQDVDSKEEAVEIGQHIGETVNESMNEFAQNFAGIGEDEHQFEIEFEKLFQRMFLGNKKKRYSGQVVWKEESGMLEEPYIDIKGFEAVRGESAPVTKELQKTIFEKILQEGAGKEEVIDYCDDLYTRMTDGRIDPRRACRSPSLGGWDKQGVHTEAARYIKEFFPDVDVNVGDSIYYVFTNGDRTGYNHNNQSLPSNRVIGVLEDMEPPHAKITCKNCDHDWFEAGFAKSLQWTAVCPECNTSKESHADSDKFEIDGCYVNWDRIADTAIKNKVEKILEPLGWEDSIRRFGHQQSMEAWT